MLWLELWVCRDGQDGTHMTPLQFTVRSVLRGQGRLLSQGEQNVSEESRGNITGESGNDMSRGPEETMRASMVNSTVLKTAGAYSAVNGGIEGKNRVVSSMIVNKDRLRL